MGYEVPWLVLAGFAALSVGLVAAEGEAADDGYGQYFEYYPHPDIHRLMIQDSLRTEAYKEALMKHGVVQGKTVLDFGCGSGILSIFAALGGARHVYCVEASDLAHTAKTIVTKNGMSNVVTVIKSKGEELDLPEQVDVIVSEWMGYLLVLEDMLYPLLMVKERWLKPEGLLMPRYADMWVQAYRDDEWWESSHGYWHRSPYGFDLSPMASLQTSDPQWPWPIRNQWRPKGLLGQAHLLVGWDLQKGLTLDGEVEESWESPMRLQAGNVTHGLVFWFDVHFEHSRGNLTLSTHPAAGVSHWGQVFWPFVGAPLAGEDLEVMGKLTLVHKMPTWRINAVWSAPPAIRHVRTMSTGDMHAEILANPDEWSAYRAYEALVRSYAREGPTSARSEL